MDSNHVIPRKALAAAAQRMVVPARPEKVEMPSATRYYPGIMDRPNLPG
jgi:hypothetical protein